MEDPRDDSVCKDTRRPEFDIWTLHGGRRALIPTSCLLTISKLPYVTLFAVLNLGNDHLLPICNCWHEKVCLKN